jgi:hypothetical protein
MPKSSPATLVNLLITLEALNIAKRNNMMAVQMQTLQTEEISSPVYLKANTGSNAFYFSHYHPAHAKYSFSPRAC